MVVMDPLALPLSCACVDGVGQRRYEALATGLSKVLHRKVDLVYEESLQLALRRAPDGIDIVIGKRSTVLHDAEATGLSLAFGCLPHRPRRIDNGSRNAFGEGR